MYETRDPIFTYIISPYTAKGRGAAKVQEFRYKEAAKFCAWLLNNKVYAFSPVVHGHAIETLTGARFSHDFWIAHSFELMRAAHKVAVLCIAGWKQSVGVRSELTVADYSRKIVEFYEPNHEFIYVRRNAKDARLTLG